MVFLPLRLCVLASFFDGVFPQKFTIMEDPMRSSGILLHITSLPSSMGVGTLAETDKFIKFLKAAKQEYWQILPITPTDFVNSPYASPSAFAGNTLLINVDELGKQGLVSEETLANAKT